MLEVHEVSGDFSKCFNINNERNFKKINLTVNGGMN